MTAAFLEQSKWSTRNPGKRAEQEIREKLDLILSQRKAAGHGGSASGDNQNQHKNVALENDNDQEQHKEDQTKSGQLQSGDMRGQLQDVAHNLRTTVMNTNLGITDKLDAVAAGLRGNVGGQIANAAHAASDVISNARNVIHLPSGVGNVLPSGINNLSLPSTRSMSARLGSVRRLGSSVRGALFSQQSAGRGGGRLMGMKALPAAIFSLLAVIAMKVLGDIAAHADFSGLTHAVRAPMKRLIPAARPAWYDFSDTFDMIKSRFQSNWNWYEHLRRPAFSVSCATHRVMWNAVLTGAFALCSFRLLTKVSQNRMQRFLALGMLMSTIAVGALWGMFVVGFRSTAVGLAYSIDLLAMTAVTCALSYRFDKLAGQLLLPAVAWLSYIVCEHAAMAYLN